MDEMKIQISEVRSLKPITFLKEGTSFQEDELYETEKDEPVPKRTFTFITCKCKLNCFKLDEASRRIIFDNFWALENWNSQTKFLRSCMIYVSNKPH